MMERGDLVVPYFNGDVFPDKPPMMYWAMIAAYKVFGRTVRCPILVGRVRCGLGAADVPLGPDFVFAQGRFVGRFGIGHEPQL